MELIKNGADPNTLGSEEKSTLHELSPDDVNTLSSTLQSIISKSKQCNEMASNFTSDIDDKKFPTKDGISLLEVKNHMLLQYVISLTGLIGMKLSGESIQESFYLSKLVELRTFVEKIRPIEGKLKYQIDKVVALADGSHIGTVEADPLKFRANLDDLQNDGDQEDSEEDEDDSDVDKDESSAKSGVYRPPRVAPQYFDEDKEAPPAKKEKNLRKKSLNQSLIRELQEEFLETPVEIHNMGDAYAKQLSREVQDKTRFEETYMTRLPVTKKDKHREKALSTIGVLGDEITLFRKKSTPTSSKSSRGKKRKSSGKSKSGKRFRK